MLLRRSYQLQPQSLRHRRAPPRQPALYLRPTTTLLFEARLLNRPPLQQANLPLLRRLRGFPHRRPVPRQHRRRRWRASLPALVLQTRFSQSSSSSSSSSSSQSKHAPNSRGRPAQPCSRNVVTVERRKASTSKKRPGHTPRPNEWTNSASTRPGFRSRWRPVALPRPQNLSALRRGRWTRATSAAEGKNHHSISCFWNAAILEALTPFAEIVQTAPSLPFPARASGFPSL